MIVYKNALSRALQRYWYFVYTIKLYAISWYVGKTNAISLCQFYIS